MELEENSISFLGVKIKRANQLIENSIYRKKMNTNSYMKWDSCPPKYQKLGLISSLVTRAYRLCSSDVILNNEVDFIKTKKILNHNGYSKKIVDRRIKNTICKEKEKAENGQDSKKEQQRIPMKNLI